MMPNGNTVIDYQKLRDIGNKISQLDIKKEFYGKHSKILNDPLTSPKAYWSILKTFYNDTKTSLILPLIINNKVIINFQRKSNFLINFFALTLIIFFNFI